MVVPFPPQACLLIIGIKPVVHHKVQSTRKPRPQQQLWHRQIDTVSPPSPDRRRLRQLFAIPTTPAFE